MNQQHLELCKGLVNPSYVELSCQGTNQYNSLIDQLLTQRRLPDQGWSDKVIETFLNQVSMMDSNNFIENIGVGEREGRVYSQLVEKRHFGFAHGIGRSGDITEQQPKAAGSSLLQKILRYLVLDAMRISGIHSNAVKELLVLPLATGMTMAMTLLSLKQIQSKSNNIQSKYVLFFRIDQKSCLKSIVTANLIPIVIEGQIDGDAIKTNIQLLRETITRLGADQIVCVLSTTSCFAPRVPDSIIEISQICKELSVAHVINNAYGLQCSKITYMISESCRIGRVDAFIQSTDKNFLVPVGGAIVASPNPLIIEQISKNYPGRASGSQQIDLIITLLSMGKEGWSSLLESRKQLLPYFVESLTNLSSKYANKLKILLTKDNKISFAIAILDDNKSNNNQSLSFIGSKLFSRQCSGSRIVENNNSKKQVGGIDFLNYGSHIDNYPYSYLTVACAIGITKHEIDTFISRFEKILENK